MGIPVLLDMDPGVDDALAILLAARSPEIEVRALTVCAGNNSAERCAFNALKTLDVAGLRPAAGVAMGAWRPLRRSPFVRVSDHGRDGLGDVLDRYPDSHRSEMASIHGVDLILRLAASHPDRRDPAIAPGSALTIIATGPLTNIALAMSKDPEALRRVERIVWMGGAYACSGNCNAVAEFNCFFDPDAAQEVLAFGVPVTAVGLDVTRECVLSRRRVMAALAERDTPALRFAAAILQASPEQEAAARDGCYLHDPLALGLFLWPDLIVRQEPHCVEVVCQEGPVWGMTVIDRRKSNPWLDPHIVEAIGRIPAGDARLLTTAGVLQPRPHVDVVMEVDAGAFVERFFARLAADD